jgi:hypothetical protein
MHREPNEHLNYTRQKEEILAAKMARDVVEEQGRKLKEAIHELLAGTGYDLDFDHYGGSGIVLRHFHQRHPASFRQQPSYYFDHEVPLDKD